MQDATKVEAVKKINSMTVKVGYPDQWPSYMAVSYTHLDKDARRK